MKYLLFIFPRSEEWTPQTDTEYVAEELLTVSSSEDIRFLFDEKQSIITFESTINQGELAMFLEVSIADCPEFTYMLIPTTSNVNTNMADEFHTHLFGKAQVVNKTKNIPNKKTRNIFDPDTEITDAHIEVINSLAKEMTTDLTVDEILDKITSQGINSLTEGERNKLDEYSKQV